ncbi:hypothetical protein GWI33_006931, partial [Rhynchophorus ferrugineus]
SCFMDPFRPESNDQSCLESVPLVFNQDVFDAQGASTSIADRGPFIFG